MLNFIKIFFLIFSLFFATNVNAETSANTHIKFKHENNLFMLNVQPNNFYEYCLGKEEQCSVFVETIDDNVIIRIADKEYQITLNAFQENAGKVFITEQNRFETQTKAGFSVIHIIR